MQATRVQHAEINIAVSMRAELAFERLQQVQFRDQDTRDGFVQGTVTIVPATTAPDWEYYVTGDRGRGPLYRASSVCAV